MKSKILSLPALARIIARLRSRGRKIVFTNGTFDLLHAGHVTYLEKAKKLGDVLVVGVNSDRSVRSYKTPERPYSPERDRMTVLAALGCVDYVIKFNEPTPLRLIQTLRPQVLAKGADWKKNKIAGAREVEARGGKVVLLPLVRGKSTTRLIQKIQSKAT